MKTAIAIIFAMSSILIQWGNGFANDVKVTKTFEHGDLLEYDLVANPADLRIKIRCSINKVTGKTHLRYGGENRISTFSTLGPVLGKLFAKADELSNGRLHSLLAFEFLNCDDIGKKGVLAFQYHQQWRNYLSNSKKQVVKPPNDFIKHTLIRKNVYQALHEAVRHAGYELELVSVEKIFEYKAERFNFYADLKTMGIEPDTIFPVPGILGFRLSPAK